MSVSAAFNVLLTTQNSYILTRTTFFTLPSVGPVGTGPQAGPLPFESYKDVSAEEKRKAPVETARKTPPDIIEHVVGRIDEAGEVADLKRNQTAW